MAFLVRILLILAFLLTPGATVLAVAVWIWHKIRLPKAGPGAFLEAGAEGSGLIITDWHAYMRARHPVRYWLTVSVPAAILGAGRRVRAPFSRWKARHWDKEFLLDMRATDYQSGHLAPGEAMLYACFATLVGYLGGDGSWILDTTDDPEDGAPDLFKAQSLQAQWLRALYSWWLVRRPTKVAEINAIEDRVDRAAAVDLQFQEDQFMLGLLLKHRSDML